MKTQNQIKRILSQPDAIKYVRGLLDNNEFVNRNKLANFLCERFGCYDLRGQKQSSGCLKALRELEATGSIRLPPAQNKTGAKTPKRLSASVATPKGVPEKAGDVRGLRLILVCGEEHMRIWNEMMIQEHPLGHGPLVGRQVRYLIGSEHGWLGALGFAAPALNLADRDKWIGWDIDQKRDQLHSIVSMSRFLIRPSVQCRNLASQVLAMSMRQLPEDFEQNYNYRPWLVESFVDTSLFAGTCYRAANWIRVGRTKGRGRQDCLRKTAKTVKDIYLYPLEKDFRARLGLSGNAGLGPLTPMEGVAEASWAEKEFGGAALGDARLSKRLVSIAAAKAQKPSRAFTGVAKGDWPAVKAYYRLIDTPEESAVTMPNILQPHRDRTIRRMKGQQTVLAIQDGCDLDYNNLAQCDGLVEIGANQTGAKSRGLHLHSTFAVTSKGLPLGVLRARFLVPKLKALEDDRPTAAIPIEEKKTYCWIEHHRDLVEIAADMPNTRVVNVCDREADFFELFDEQRSNPRVELLVRAKHNRNLTEEPFKLFEAVRRTPVQSRVRVHLPRQSARPKRSKQKARPGRSARVADLAVRFTRIQIQPSSYCKDKKPIDVWMLHALEENAPPQTKAVEWFLLTTIDITSAQDAEQCLRWYCLRWRIEDWHRVLKSGCRIEDIAHETAERLRRAIAINLVIAWRIMLMTLLGRDTPELAAEVLFSDIEIRVLSAYAKKKS